ncbi:hypothetical protein F5883DRAFT_45854 [Diaporthe sp. PMI_573]|nr:hypothetical protein F5883DRAFT_45854 [Diaporthaceae sp. PMI_573]
MVGWGLVVLVASACGLAQRCHPGNVTGTRGKAAALRLWTLRSATLAEGYMQSYAINLRRNLCGRGSPQRTASQACCHPGPPGNRMVAMDLSCL